MLSLFDDCWCLSRDSTGDVIASRQLRLMFENHLFSAGWMQCQWPQMGRDRFASAEKQLFQFESNVRCDTSQPMHRKETKKMKFTLILNKLTKLGRCDRTAELQTAELLKLLILLEE